MIVPCQDVQVHLILSQLCNSPVIGYSNVFNQCFLDGHLYCFRSSVSNDAVNKSLSIQPCACVLSTSEVELLHRRIHIFNFLIDVDYMPSRHFTIYPPSNTVWGIGLLLHTLKVLSCQLKPRFDHNSIIWRHLGISNCRFMRNFKYLSRVRVECNKSCTTAILEGILTLSACFREWSISVI